MDTFWLKLLDIAERSFWTFVQAFSATVILVTNGDLTWTAVKVGAGSAVLAVLKALSLESTIIARIRGFGRL